MGESKWARVITYEEELDPSFPRQVALDPGGERLFNCIQCGTCSGVCPVTPYMDYTPRQIIAMTRAGFKKQVLGSLTIWLCASCYSCTVECPKEIRITDVMYALKQRSIQERAYPKRFPITVLAREFYKIIFRYGRDHESELLTRTLLKTAPLSMFKQVTLGLGLLRTGRMPLLPDKVKARHGAKGDLQKMLLGVRRREKAGTP